MPLRLKTNIIFILLIPKFTKEMADFQGFVGKIYYYYSRCLSTDWRSANEAHEGRSAFFHLVISAPLNHRYYVSTLGHWTDAWACRRQILILIPVISTSSITVLLSVPELVEGRFSLIILWFRQAQSPCYSRCLSLSKAHSHSYSLWFLLCSITVLLSVPEPVEGTIYQSLSV